jgi:hypothetical protein
MNANVKSTKVNKVVKGTTTKVINATKKVEKVAKVTYLTEGVTGKQMMRSIFDANNAHKQDLGTFSQCLKRATEFGATELAKNIKGFDVKECTPKNLIPLRTKDMDAKFSVYEVLMLIKKFYQTK